MDKKNCTKYCVVIYSYYIVIIQVYITEDYTSLCLNIICNRNFFKWGQLCSSPSFTQGWKDFGTKTYLFTTCANCYLWFWGKVIFKTGNIPSTWSYLNTFVRFECDNSAIDVIIYFLWKIFHKPIGLVVLKFPLARQKIYWSWAIGPPLISNTVYSYKFF